MGKDEFLQEIMKLGDVFLYEFREKGEIYLPGTYPSIVKAREIYDQHIKELEICQEDKDLRRYCYKESMKLVKQGIIPFIDLRAQTTSLYNFIKGDSFNE